MQVISGEYCLDASNNWDGDVTVATCNSTELSQQWHYEAYSRQLRHLSSDLCLDSDGANGVPMNMQE